MAKVVNVQDCGIGRILVTHFTMYLPESFVSDDFVYQCQYIWFFYLYKFESWKWLFSTVRFQMTSQKACLWYKVTLVAFNLTSPQCAFGNSFSNCLSQRMLNCKGCMVFPVSLQMWPCTAKIHIFSVAPLKRLFTFSKELLDALYDLINEVHFSSFFPEMSFKVKNYFNTKMKKRSCPSS